MVLIARWRDDHVLAARSGQYPACPDPLQSKTAGRRVPKPNSGMRASLAKKAGAMRYAAKYLSR